MLTVRRPSPKWTHSARNWAHSVPRGWSLPLIGCFLASDWLPAWLPSEAYIMGNPLISHNHHQPSPTVLRGWSLEQSISILPLIGCFLVSDWLPAWLLSEAYIMGNSLISHNHHQPSPTVGKCWCQPYDLGAFIVLIDTTSPSETLCLGWTKDYYKKRKYGGRLIDITSP